MKTTLSAFKLPILAVAITFFTSSCELFKKDDPEPLKNEVSYNNTKYTLDESLMIKYGGYSLFGDENTHVVNHFYFANGNIDYNTTTGEVDEINGSFAVFAEVASASTSDFKTGAFNYTDGSNDNSLNDTQLEAKYKNKSVFSVVEVYIDNNGNGILSDEVPVLANGGTINVSGSNNSYALEYNLTLANGKTVKGKTASTFSQIGG